MSELKLGFVGIGMAKAGTTWTFKTLREHPQVCLPKRKELNYFIDRHVLQDIRDIGTYYSSSQRKKGSEWFNSNFNHRTNGELLGEISPSYFSNSVAPKHLFQNDPKLKIIVNYRNPVDTLYSAHFQLLKMIPVRGTFEELIEKYPVAKEYFKCYSNVLKFKEYFPDEQIHYISLEDIKNRSTEVFENLCDFLEIEKIIEPDIAHERVNPRTVVKSNLVRDIIWNSIGLINHTRFLSMTKPAMRGIGLEKLSTQVRRMNFTRGGKTEPMNPDTRSELIKLYKDDILNFSDLVKRDLTHWLEIPANLN